MQSIDWKVKVKLGKRCSAAVQENAGGNDTVPISVWRVGDMHNRVLLL